jgi:hypothetical protein
MDLERWLPTQCSRLEKQHTWLITISFHRNGHYGRALEEAIQTNKGQWPSAWKGINPLHGGRSFNGMDSAERVRSSAYHFYALMLTSHKLALLRALIMWSLHESEHINAIIKESYKQSRQTDDLYVPLSVQAWGKDGLKRRYWLIEGRDDTPFRLYRENNPVLKNGTWWSVAGTIDELKLVVEKLEKETAQASKRLAHRITLAIPRFEATEEVSIFLAYCITSLTNSLLETPKARISTGT